MTSAERIARAEKNNIKNKPVVWPPELPEGMDVRFLLPTKEHPVPVLQLRIKRMW